MVFGGGRVSINAIGILTQPEKLEELLKGLLKVSNIIKVAKEQIELHNINNRSFLPKSLIVAARPLATGFGILGGGLIIFANCVAVGTTAPVTLASIGTGIVSIATGIAFIDKS